MVSGMNHATTSNGPPTTLYTEPGAPAPAAPTGITETATAIAGRLPATGSDTSDLAVTGGLVLAVGVVLAVLCRRRPARIGG